MVTQLASILDVPRPRLLLMREEAELPTDATVQELGLCIADIIGRSCDRLMLLLFIWFALRQTIQYTICIVFSDVPILWLLVFQSVSSQQQRADLWEKLRAELRGASL